MYNQIIKRVSAENVKKYILNLIYIVETIYSETKNYSYFCYKMPMLVMHSLVFNRSDCLLIMTMVTIVIMVTIQSDPRY